MPEWSFLTRHARVLLCIASDPNVRVRDMATILNTTERTVTSIVADLVRGGYVVRGKRGRRNRYDVQTDRTVVERTARDHTIGELLNLLVGQSELNGHE